MSGPATGVAVLALGTLAGCASARPTRSGVRVEETPDVTGSATFWLALLVALAVGLVAGYLLSRRRPAGDATARVHPAPSPGTRPAPATATSTSMASTATAPPRPARPAGPPIPDRATEPTRTPRPASSTAGEADDRVTTPVTGLPRQGPDAGPDAGTHRAALVELCVDLADRLRAEHPGLRARVHRGLATVGVTPLEPDGRPFDREQHDAVDREPTSTPARDRTVASTELTGYVDHGRLLRRPEVVVYALEVTDDERRDDGQER